MALADRFLDNAIVTGDRDVKKLGEACDWIYRKLYFDPNATVIEMQELAERYVFEERMAPTVKRIQKDSDDLDYTVIMASVGLVNNPVWIEFPIVSNDRKCKVGMLAEMRQDEFIWIGIVGSDPGVEDGTPFVVGLLRIPTMPWGMELASSNGGLVVDVIAWVTNDDPVKEIINGFIYDFIDAMFLIGTPRIAEIQHVKHDRKLQESRIKKGKKPFLEFKRVKLVVGKHYATNGGGGDGAPGVSRKAHRVTGHVRTYRTFRNGSERDQPLLSWVPEHWRGDERLGVVIHQRNVRTED